MPIPRLHIITDTTVQQRYSHFELAQLAWSAGPCAVQYRNKSYAAADLPELQAIAAMARETGQTLIINDRLDLAQDIGAQGIHLGQEDADPAWAAAQLGPQALIGATVHNLAELEALQGKAISYIGVGPVFGTQSKSTGLPALGLDGLAALCAASAWPVIAIGGIELAHVAAVRAAGAYGIAVIGAFCKAADPQAAALALLKSLADA